MAKPLAASKKLMQNYLSELLTEDEVVELKVQRVAVSPSVMTKEKEFEEKKLERLLQGIPLPEAEEERVLSYKAKETTKKHHVEKSAAVMPQQKLATSDKVKAQETPSVLAAKERSYRSGRFQAMFFDVAGLIVAVPLIELGGIYNAQEITSLMGKPSWFKGIMLHRDEKINVVDTALWVMPEKYDQKLKDSLNYKYIIMLSNSPWGLLAESLVDTVTLDQDDVKWLDAPSKRPWLAGLVKDRMCALLEVESLIALLNAGVNVNKK